MLWDISIDSLQDQACRIANRNLTYREWEQYLGRDMPYWRTCPTIPLDPAIMDEMIEQADAHAREGLTKQAETLRRGIEGIEKKLSNESFVAKAPAEVVERERERLGELKRDMAALSASLELLG